MKASYWWKILLFTFFVLVFSIAFYFLSTEKFVGKNTYRLISTKAIDVEMVLAKHYDVNDMIFQMIDLHVARINRAFSDMTLEWELRKFTLDDFDLNENHNGNPKFIVYYKEIVQNGKKGKIFSALKANKEFSCFASNKNIDCNEPNVDIFSDLNDLFEYYGRLERLRPLARSYLKATKVYTEFELEMLISFVGVRSFLNAILENIYADTDRVDYLLKKEARIINDNILLIYSDYLLKNHIYYILWENLKYNIGIIFLLTLSVIFLIHIFRRDLFFLTKEELKKHNIEVNYKIYFDIIFSNWHYLLWPPGKSKKLSDDIAVICEKIKLEQEQKIIADQAKMIWKEIPKNSLRYLELKKYFKDACEGKRNVRKDSLEFRRRALKVLEKGLIWQREREVLDSQKSNEVTFVNDGKKGGSADRKKELIDRLNEMLPKNISLSFSCWSINNLECLILALIVLPEMHKDAIDALLQKENLKELLLNRTPFMKAVREENEEKILKELNLTTLQEDIAVPTQIKPKKKDYSNLLLDTEVIVIGAIRSSQQQSYIEAVKKLGAVNSQFIHPGNLRKIQSVASMNASKTIICLMIGKISHDVSEVFKKQKQENIIPINNTGVTSLRKAIIDYTEKI